MEQDMPYWEKTPNAIARKYFKDNNLSYDDVTKARWRMLIAILEKHLEQRNKEQEEIEKQDKWKKDYTYELDKCVYNKKTKQKPFITAYINVKVDNYSIREGISFNSDGWIGFAGWASTYNTIPFTNAFMEWVDWLVKEKNNEQNARETISTNI